MERFIQFDPISMRHFSTTKWPFPPHNHNHYELIFLHAGNGTHILNNVTAAYQAPAIYLLAPEDQHQFIVKAQTEFSVIKFLPVSLSGHLRDAEEKEWHLLMGELIVNSQLISELLPQTLAMNKLETLFKMMVAEWKEMNEKSNELMVHLLRSILIILKSNILVSSNVTALMTDNLPMQIVHHIHAHIQSPESLTIDSIGAQFSLSGSYLSSLFRKEIGMSLKEYISNYKLKLIKTRLKYSRSLIKEISHDFGFSDISHFNKFVKRHAGVNPKELREKNGQ
ncbi:AraC family transcriptional regulator [Chitinophaga arvensicola]|uniref:AraC-type DNA-binding protein n=1 Tax=Chitinophaga arvensicola TaxID=29529 RepID=A0A1I0SA35_9BACT|nr:AraC family transcriptional regulator [Chitinophaga arvensicola]SEW53014.1 AraC-type DNA-binding protein [Chitinophaga arvensicola]